MLATNAMITTTIIPTTGTSSTGASEAPTEKLQSVQQPTLVEQEKRSRTARQSSAQSREDVAEKRCSMVTPDLQVNNDSPTISDSDNDNDIDCDNDIDNDDSSPSKRRKLSPDRRVSFSNAQSVVVEVERKSDMEKHYAWYKTEDYSQFICSAHLDAQRLRHAAQSATSSEALYLFIQSANLSPRGLEKVLHYGSSSDDEDDSSSSSEEEQSSSKAVVRRRSKCRGFPINNHSRKIKRLKAKHRQVLLSMHRNHKESGNHNPEELRRFSEDSSRWAVETALKLGDIDAQGLI